MAKLTLSDLASLANQTSAMATINANSAAIEAAVENTLSRDGTAPNSMEAALDMNDNRIMNLPAPVSDTEPVRLMDMEGTIDVIDSLSVLGASLVQDTTTAEMRTTLELGTSSTINTGTSGATIPLLNGTNTASGVNTFSNTTESTSTSTGAVVIAGGLGVAKDAFFGDDVNIADDLIVVGDASITGPTTLGAGTTTTAPLTLTSGTNLTTAAAGAIEFDGKTIYGTAAASSRQVINAEQFTILSANYALTDSSTAQKAFNATANGAVTLQSETTYEFEAQYLITNTGTSSHTWGCLFAGTATITSGVMTLKGRGGGTSAATLTAETSAYTTDLTTVLVGTGALTSATENTILNLRGIVRINAGGTFIPQVKLSATTSGTITMLANSFFRCWPVGANTVTNVGNWS